MIKNIFLAFLGVFFFGALPAAQAGWFWEADKDTDFRPYLENGTAPQHAQERLGSWYLADWAPSKAAGDFRLDRFFRAGVLTNYTDQNTVGAPILTVGTGFYHLSSYDKKRVAMLVDYVHRATATPAGTFFIKDGGTGQIIGAYTRGGAFGLQ